MDLNDSDRHALIHHLAERLPAWSGRAEVARAAGLGDVQLSGDPVPVWTAVVDEAIDQDAVRALIRAARRARPDDPVFQAIDQSLDAGDPRIPPVDDPKRWLQGAVAAGAVVLLLGAGALVVDAAGLRAAPPADTAPPAVDHPQVQSPPAAGAAATEPPATDARAADGIGDTGAAGDPDAPDDPVDSDAGAPVDPAARGGAGADAVEAPTQASSSSTSTPADPAPPGAGQPCATPAGQVVGYAYAGRDDPGAVGETWTLARSLNVRADYPRRDNGWNARAEVRCVLGRGSTVRLVQAPIAVDGGAFWVPVVGGTARRASD